MPTLAIATSIVKKLKAAGHTAYFAGGWVRDLSLQKPSDDIDIATSASVSEVQALFPKTIPVGVAFGIVIVVEGDHKFEVATFRKDRGYTDGRRPTGIERASPEEDATRRDFTINGMFFDPIENKILDYVKGQEDINKKIIRAIGDPHERFLEDRLRMMRAIRYSTRFDFPIEKNTQEAIIAQAHTLLPAVAMERVWQEFKKMSQFAHFDTGLITLQKLGLLSTIFPDLKNIEITPLVKPIPDFPKDAPPISELLQLFPNYTSPQIESLCDYLKLSKEEKTFALFLQAAKKITTLEKIAWAKFYASPYSEITLKIIAANLPKEERAPFLHEHLLRRQSLEKPILRIQSNTPLITSDDLLKAGIPPGKQMGLLLKEAERLSVNENLEDKALILKKILDS